MRPLLIALALVTTAAVPGIARDRDEVPAAEPAGDPVDCVHLRTIRASHVRSDRVIDFEMAGGKTYRNTLPQACPNLGSERRFSHRSSIAELCSVDTITVLYASPFQAGATCGLGQFQPVHLTGSR